MHSAAISLIRQLAMMDLRNVYVTNMIMLRKHRKICVQKLVFQLEIFPVLPIAFVQVRLIRPHFLNHTRRLLRMEFHWRIPRQLGKLVENGLFVIMMELLHLLVCHVKVTELIIKQVRLIHLNSVSTLILQLRQCSVN